VGVMLGYCTNAKGYRVLLQNDDGTYYVAQSRDVVFDETIVASAFQETRERQ
jgi:hypothetical protein